MQERKSHLMAMINVLKSSVESCDNNMCVKSNMERCHSMYRLKENNSFNDIPKFCRSSSLPLLNMQLVHRAEKRAAIEKGIDREGNFVDNGGYSKVLMVRSNPMDSSIDVNGNFVLRSHS
uniref:Uncharacterized protein n=1 Tax=Hanusia phi TaxID=3032 RepID=A0A7S0ERC0_9CRYP|mmetsp:Transcript_29493/g.66769  ORF Transcript_29493/g.66769 Transcript_29493/m.66769 type:complete len:120 (+) Transcript_29493:203-562(+)